MSPSTTSEKKQLDDSQIGKALRVWVRYPCQVRTVCQPVAARGDDDPQWAATIQDISVGGIGLIAVRRFEPGTGLAIEIPPEGDYLGDTLLARVVRVKQRPGEGWLLGCSFVSPLSEDTVQNLAQLNKEQTVPPEEQHEQDHSETNGNDHSQEKAIGRSIVIPRVRWHNLETGTNRIARRFFLTGSWPISPRTVLKLWVERKTGEKEFTRALVHSCTKQGDDWIINYSILGKPAPELDCWPEEN